MNTEQLTGANDNTGIIDLKGMQKKFALAYIRSNCQNASAAAREAGYKADNDASLRVTASRLANNPKIKKYIDQFFAENVMSAAETLHHLTHIARAGHIGSFVSVEGGAASIDLSSAADNGDLAVMAKYKRTTKRVVSGPNEDPDTIEIVSEEVTPIARLDALKTIAQHHKLLTQNVNHSGEIAQPITMIDYGLDDDDDDEGSADDA